MKYEFKKSSIEETKTMMEDYLNTLTCITDDYWEAHILEADFYRITKAQEDLGFFTVHNNEKLTVFYIREDYYNLAQSIFKQILETYNIKTAYVTTGDQLFLSLCLDYHAKLELQAYFFDGAVKREVNAPEYPRECLIRVKPEELEQVLRDTGDFFQPISKEILEKETYQLYKLCEGGDILGYGIIVPNTLLKQYWPCGMITMKKHRRKGVGRSLQLHLADICRENGYIPVSGCWYYNHLSKKTIESAGRFTKTRLLNVIF